MALRRHYRVIVVAVAMALCFVGGFRNQSWLGLNGFFYDAALAVRGAQPLPVGWREPVVVVGLDQRSLAADDLQTLPRALFAPVWSELVSALFAAETKTVGFDILFVWSASGLIPRHDQPLLQTLNRNKESVVIARTGRWPPARPYFFAMGGGRIPDAVAHVELSPDDDGIVRRVPLALSGPEGPVPTMAASLYRRSGGEVEADTAMPVLLAPRRPLTHIPTYPLVDVLRCAADNPDLVAEHFAGKTVLIGTILPDEDRKRAPDRFFEIQEPPRPSDADSPDCRLQAGFAGREGATIPGVYLHAEAVRTLLTGETISVMPDWRAGAAASGAALIGAVLGLLLSPVIAIAAVIIVSVGVFGAGVFALENGVWMPLAAPIVSVIAAVVFAYIVRFLVEDRRRRKIQSAFSHYLAPSLVNELADSETPPALGGATASVTIMFADLSGFTALSGTVGPEELMRRTNRYLAMIADAVHETGGYVDKFIGDAVMAIWGAPVDQSDHAVRAVRAARAVVSRVADARAQDAAEGSVGFAVKVGLNSGEATVGNVGGAERFNYTAVGETVNLAARLESVPTDYDCRLVVGESTARLAGEVFQFCELDWIKVKGKVQPLIVYEPVAEKTGDLVDVDAYCAGFAAALKAYRNANFAEAEALWKALDYRAAVGLDSEQGGPPTVMADRARVYREDGAPPHWDGVWVRAGK